MQAKTLANLWTPKTYPQSIETNILQAAVSRLLQLNKFHSPPAIRNPRLNQDPRKLLSISGQGLVGEAGSGAELQAGSFKLVAAD
jgi:hypothetical protein